MKTNLKNILSSLVLAIFILSAFASSDFSFLGDSINNGWDRKTEFLGNRTQQETSVYSTATVQKVDVQTGQFDEKGRLQGEVEVVQTAIFSNNAEIIEKEWKINYVDGLRHGKLVLYFKKTPPGTVIIDTFCYKMNIEVDCADFVPFRNNEESAYDIFENRYPLNWYDYKALGFDEIYMEKYMDSIQSIIQSFDFDAAKFDDYYDDAIDLISLTPFDSLVRINDDYFIINLLDLLQNGTFRLAVFDRYLSDHSSTFDVLNTFYPDYVLNMEELEIPPADLQSFCHVYDSLLNSYNLLDINDELFPFDLDSLMYKAFNEIDSLENEVLVDVKNAVLLWSIFEFYFEADPIRESQREAYFLNNNAILPPVLTTSFRSNLPDNQAEVEGFVVSDGGGQIEQRGMAWAQHNNPTIDDDFINVDGSLGSYTVVISGLSPGETYFARSFAKYTEGIAYGNSARFTAEEVPSSNEDIKLSSTGISIFPNPATTGINIKFEAEMTELNSIQIADISGKTVLSIPKLVATGQGESLNINISALADGMYNCIMISNNGKVFTKKFVVIH